MVKNHLSVPGKVGREWQWQNREGKLFHVLELCYNVLREPDSLVISWSGNQEHGHCSMFHRKRASKAFLIRITKTNNGLRSTS